MKKINVGTARTIASYLKLLGRRGYGPGIKALDRAWGVYMSGGGRKEFDRVLGLGLEYARLKKDAWLNDRLVRVQKILLRENPLTPGEKKEIELRADTNEAMGKVFREGTQIRGEYLGRALQGREIAGEYSKRRNPPLSKEELQERIMDIIDFLHGKLHKSKFMEISHGFSSLENELMSLASQYRRNYGSFSYKSGGGWISGGTKPSDPFKENPYRLHISSPAGHTTYQDFDRKSRALKSWKKNFMDKRGWFATHIEKIDKKIFKNPLTTQESAALIRESRSHERDARKHKDPFLKAFDQGTSAGLRESVYRYGTHRGKIIAARSGEIEISRRNPTPFDKRVAEYMGEGIYRNAVNGMYYATGYGAADTLSGMKENIRDTKNPRKESRSSEILRHIKRIEDFLAGGRLTPASIPTMKQRIKDLKKEYDSLQRKNPPQTAVLIGRKLKAVEYYDAPKAKAEGLDNPGLPWRHDAKGGGAKVYGLPDGSVLLKGKKKLWDYR